MIDPIIQFRRTLHHYPELSGEEYKTAERVTQFFSALQPDSLIQNLGGTGVAIVFCGVASGPTVLLRCELDAVPIQEKNSFEYSSAYNGISHKCGHDGHMAILAAVGSKLATEKPKRGKVVLLYQPAEETGTGATAVINDPGFAAIKPNFAYALHNMPGYPLGQVILRNGVFTCASRGICIKLFGTAAHAAQPESGVSPSRAMCSIIHRFSNLPPIFTAAGETVFITTVGSRMGNKAFGTAPDMAEIWATLRSETDETMDRLSRYSERVVHEAAAADKLQVTLDYEDIFHETTNSNRAVELVKKVATTGRIAWAKKPLRWSEDFGRITALCTGALVGIGSGRKMPDLHNPDYDFPDALIRPARDLLLRIIDQHLNN